MVRPLPFFSIVGLLGLLTLGQGHAQSRPGALPNSSQVLASTAARPSASAPAQSVISPDSVFINPEVRPQFVGGDKAFTAYLVKNIRYPQQALQRGVSGRVYVSFVLSATGKVQDAHVMSGPGNGLNDEALRLVWLMPPWEPARSNGQPVRVACTVPISFNSGR